MQHDNHFADNVEISEDFDALAKGYVRLHRSWLYDTDVLAEVPIGARALEVGCGIGTLTVELAKRCRSVTAVDVSKAMLQIARSRCEGLSVNFEECDSLDVSTKFQHGVFDIVISKFVLHDAKDPLVHLRGWASILDSGARIVVLDRYCQPSNLSMCLAALHLEWWMFRKLRGMHFSLSTSIRMLLEDQHEWWSAPWRQHRKHERIRSYQECVAIWRSLFAQAVIRPVNLRSYLATVKL